MTSEEDTAIRLSPTDIKNKAQLMKEVKSFANMLHQAAEKMEGVGRDDQKVVLTFPIDAAEALALTLHQLIWVFEGTGDN